MRFGYGPMGLGWLCFVFLFGGVIWLDFLECFKSKLFVKGWWSCFLLFFLQGLLCFFR